MRFKIAYSQTAAILALLVFGLAQSVFAGTDGSSNEGAPEFERCPIEASLAELPDSDSGSAGGEDDPRFASLATEMLVAPVFMPVAVITAELFATPGLSVGHLPPARAPPLAG